MNPASPPARSRTEEPGPRPDPVAESASSWNSTPESAMETRAGEVRGRPRTPCWQRPGLRLVLALLVSAAAHLLLFSLFVLQPPAPRGAEAGTRAAVVRLPTTAAAAGSAPVANPDSIPGSNPDSGTPSAPAGSAGTTAAWQASARAAGAPRPVPLQPIPAAPGGPPPQSLTAGGFRYPELISTAAAELPDLDALPPPQPDPQAAPARIRHRPSLEFVWQGAGDSRDFQADESLQAAFRPLLQGTDRAPLRLPAALGPRGEVVMVLVPASVPGPNRHRFAELCRHLEVSESSSPPAVSVDRSPVPNDPNSTATALRWGVLTVHQ